MAALMEPSLPGEIEEVEEEEVSFVAKMLFAIIRL